MKVSSLFSDSAVYEIRLLLRHKRKFCLGSVQISFAAQTSGADGDDGLVHIVFSTAYVGLFP